MLEIKELSFQYSKKQKPVLEDFSLSLDKGHVYGLLGKNGAGKSTLLYLMCGLLQAKQGEVLLNGDNVWKRLPHTLEEIFLIPEEFVLPNVTMDQYVRVNAPFYPRFSEELLYNCLRDFDMEGDIRLGELSMGQKKKAFLCFALATNTSLILMDEPSNGLDIPSKSQFRKVIASGMTDEKSVVISTHQVRDVDMLLDHVVMIDDGKVQLNSSVQRLCERFCFEERAVGEPLEDALFVQPSLYGNGVVLPNRAGVETPLQLEWLFNAVLSDAGRVRQILEDECLMV